MFQRFTKWKKRHGIEFFGGLLAALLLILAVDVGGVLSYTASADRDYLSGTPYYATTFITSRSQLTGNIVGFYVNPDRTRCGIMVEIPNIMNMSVNALDYEIYVRGFNVSKGQYTRTNLNYPSGGYYVFGNTGYAMIYLVNSAGFAEQACEIIVRSNKTLIEGTPGGSDLSSAMESLKQYNTTFAEFDQYRLVINPAASNATEVDFLDPVDIMAAYRYCVLDQEEASVREKLYSDVAQLNTYMREINEYKSVLETMNVRTPALPDTISGDRFVNCPDENGGICEFSDVQAVPLTTVDKNGVVTETVYPVYYPEYIYSKGTNFDWQHHTLSDGSGTDFYDGLLLANQSKDQYLKALAAESNANTSVSLTVESLSMMDGTKLTSSMQNSTRTDEQQVYQAAKRYVDAVNNYQTLKRTYQVSDLVSYLTLQYNMEVSAQTFTSNLVDGVVRVWG